MFACTDYPATDSCPGASSPHPLSISFYSPDRPDLTEPRQQRQCPLPNNGGGGGGWDGMGGGGAVEKWSQFAPDP